MVSKALKVKKCVWEGEKFLQINSVPKWYKYIVQNRLPTTFGLNLMCFKTLKLKNCVWKEGNFQPLKCIKQSVSKKKNMSQHFEREIKLQIYKCTVLPVNMNCILIIRKALERLAHLHQKMIVQSIQDILKG